MQPDQILSLQPGHELDKAVHAVVFANDGRLFKYSTTDSCAAKLLDRLPLFVGRVDPTHAKFDINRPWVAGTLAHDPATKGDLTVLRVTSATRMGALCKAALLLVLHPPQSAQPAGRMAVRRQLTQQRPQPMPARSFRQQRSPMPKRPEKFVAPTPPAPQNGGGEK